VLWNTSHPAVVGFLAPFLTLVKGVLVMRARFFTLTPCVRNVLMRWCDGTIAVSDWQLATVSHFETLRMRRAGMASE
jgi:hypothetical protein